MFTAVFWKDTLERVIRAFAHGMLATLGIGAVTPASIPWYTALIGGIFGALLSLLTCLAAGQVSPQGTAGLVDTSVIEKESGRVANDVLLFALTALVILVLIWFAVTHFHVNR